MLDPTRVGPYQIVRRIGRGGTGRTYLGVRDPEHGGVLVCIKTPHPAFARDARYLELFDHEAAVASTLDHPHIVSLYDRGVDESGLHYLTYPYIEGADLGELIASAAAQRGQLGWNLVALIAHQGGLALESAHTDHRGSGRHHERPPIVHRDICPANILVGLSGAAYLADFGFARVAEDSSLQPSLSGAGRFAYAAPERLLGEGGYDPRADLFSFGVSLFEALTNRRPFAAGSLEAHVRHVLDGDRDSVEDHRAEFLTGSPVHPGLRQLIDVVHRLLEPDPRDRYGSAAELVDSVRAILLPAGTHRELANVAREHMPAWRRSVKHTTGKREVVASSARGGLWSGTDPLQLEHLASKMPDSVWVSPEAAEKLIASYVIGEADPNLAEIDSTVRDRPVVAPTPAAGEAIDETVLDRPVLPIEDSSSKPLVIPTTNPFHGVVRIEVDEPIPTTISTARPVVSLEQLETMAARPHPPNRSLWIARAVLVAVPVLLAAGSVGLLLVPNAFLNGMGALGLSLAAASGLGWLAWRVRDSARRRRRQDEPAPVPHP